MMIYLAVWHEREHSWGGRNGSDWRASTYGTDLLHVRTPQRHPNRSNFGAFCGSWCTSGKFTHLLLCWIDIACILLALLNSFLNVGGDASLDLSAMSTGSNWHRNSTGVCSSGWCSLRQSTDGCVHELHSNVWRQVSVACKLPAARAAGECLAKEMILCMQCWGGRAASYAGADEEQHKPCSEVMIWCAETHDFQKESWRDIQLTRSLFNDLTPSRQAKQAANMHGQLILCQEQFFLVLLYPGMFRWFICSRLWVHFALHDLIHHVAFALAGDNLWPRQFCFC